MSEVTFRIMPNVQHEIEPADEKPYSVNVNDIPRNRGLEAMREASRIASENGISDMTLDEINAEIDYVRKQVAE